MRLAAGRKLTAWWDGPTDLIRSRSIAGTTSNIRPVNYTGPDACAKCHPGNFEDWSHHPHRWMNVPASSATVRADFSPGAEIAYRGGKATFRQSGGKYQMHLVRDGVARTYEITQTIGSRFYQYFVGKQTEGPEPPEHHFYHKDHVLPFGYWLAKKEWVPVVHIGPEKPDDLRPDPYRPPDRGLHYAEYAASCNYCHTTFALGDMMARRPSSWRIRAPLDALLGSRLSGADSSRRPPGHDGLDGQGGGRRPPSEPDGGLGCGSLRGHLRSECEACHLGCQEHVASEGKTPPRFFPEDPQLLVESNGKGLDPGRTHDNVNWACGRCHIGSRPSFAAGMSTWNSVEYSDAIAEVAIPSSAASIATRRTRHSARNGRLRPSGTTPSA